MGIPVEKLIEANRTIKRRIHPFFVGKTCKFRDSREEVLRRVGVVGPPQMGTVAKTENPFKDSRVDLERPYHFDSGDDIRGFIGLKEIKLLLGTDYYEEAGVDDIRIMLEAAVSGPVNANVYVLGGSYSGGNSKDPNFVDIPIQYYRIPQKRHGELALTPEEINSARRRLGV